MEAEKNDETMLWKTDVKNELVQKVMKAYPK